MNPSRFSRPLRAVLVALTVTFALGLPVQAQTFTSLVSFNGSDGAVPYNGSLAQATNGNYYGSTYGGGSDGTVFLLTPTGTLKHIYNFCSLANCADGTNPWSSPVLASDGNLYGTTNVGGNSNNSGTVYKITPSGKLTTLYSFCPSQPCNDGQFPIGLIQGFDGNFYGVASEGGAFGQGTFFQLSPTGKFKLLHTFCATGSCSGGSFPLAAPMQASNGIFYGVTSSGGSNSSGTIYQISPSGSFKVLYNFCSQASCADGSDSEAALVEDNAGNLYGTTYSGGANGDGEVFRLAPGNQFSVLHSFNGADGSNSLSAVTFANDGDLYGTTVAGGTFNDGVIFQLTTQGAFSTLFSFCNNSGCAGNQPQTTLLQATNGLLYGATPAGGSSNDGTLFSFWNNLSASVQTVPAGGRVGRNVIILGNGLTGSTSVTFNGVPASFAVKSDTYIQATVPAGATTGTVSVVTPSGTLNSNPRFVVTQ